MGIRFPHQAIRKMNARREARIRIVHEGQPHFAMTVSFGKSETPDQTAEYISNLIKSEVSKAGAEQCVIRLPWKVRFEKYANPPFPTIPKAL